MVARRAGFWRSKVRERMVRNLREGKQFAAKAAANPGAGGPPTFGRPGKGDVTSPSNWSRGHSKGRHSKG